ncbi:MAG: hypothetical protein HC842_04620 [Cytophagales bacterium]|nr:hypothetical protein [Cytophagales bacterium]
MKANLLILLTFAALPSAFAETQHALRNQGLSARPDIPGHFVIDLGISNFYLNTPSTEIGGWSSRTINAYYFYEFKLGDSRFSFRPGLGAGMDRYSFTNNKFWPRLRQMTARVSSCRITFTTTTWRTLSCAEILTTASWWPITWIYP